MEPESKKKKTERTTPDQLRYYIDFVKNHPQMITAKNCPTSKKMLDALWKEVADGLNSMRGPSRDHTKWKESLQVWKNQIRCRARKHKAHMLATGADSSMSGLSEFEEIALSVLGAEAVTGVNNVKIKGFGETSVEDRSRTDHITQVEADVIDTGNGMDGAGTIDVETTKLRGDIVDGDADDILGEKHNLQTTVNPCKRKWKNLRDAHRAEVRRYLRRLKSDELVVINVADLDNQKCKSITFPSLTFLNENTQFNDFSIDNETNNSNSNDHNQMDDTYNSCSSVTEPTVHSIADIKVEPSHMETNQNSNEDDDDDAVNDLLFEEFEEFENIATPQAATRISETVSMNNSNEKDPPSKQRNTFRSTGTTTPKCKCSQSTQEEVHFLQDLGRKEQNLMKSTRQDITRCKILDHIGDFDFNFLISFLPQVKKMSELQNLRFRAKMGELVLNILTETSTQDTPETQ